jgi:hypothetical protein
MSDVTHKAPNQPPTRPTQLAGNIQQVNIQQQATTSSQQPAAQQPAAGSNQQSAGREKVSQKLAGTRVAIRVQF